MIATLQYIYHSNIRWFSTLLLVFIGIQMLLFMDMKVFHLFNMPTMVRDRFSFGLFSLSSIICGVWIFAQAITTFRRLIRQTMLRTAPIATSAFIIAPLLAWIAGAAILGVAVAVTSSLYSYTEVRTLLNEPWQYIQTLGLQNIIIVILMFGAGCQMLLVIFFCVALAKSIPAKKGWQVILAFVFFSLVSSALVWLSDLMMGIGPSYTAIAAVDVQRGGMHIVMDEVKFSILGSLFDWLTFAAFLFGTAYLIDKRIEG